MSWVTITDFPNYEVSDAGEVRNSVTGKILKNAVDKDGYHVITLSLGSRKEKKTVKVHRLVAICHISNPENKPQVDHLDRDKTNNDATNLQWVSNTENQQNKGFYSHKAIGDRHNIIQIPCGSFNVRFRGNRVLNKTFKTLEEAVVFRDQWMIDNPR